MLHDALYLLGFAIGQVIGYATVLVGFEAAGRAAWSYADRHPSSRFVRILRGY